MTTNTLAEALATAELPSREVAGLIYKTLNLETPIAMGTAPDIQSVHDRTKAGWQYAATAVLSKVPEYVAGAVSGHRSVQVRRLYAGHGTDPSTLRALESDALCDRSTAAHWAAYVDFDWLYERCSSHHLYLDVVYEVLGRRLVASGREDLGPMVRRVARRGRADVYAGIIHQLTLDGRAGEIGAVLATCRTRQERQNALEAAYTQLDGVVSSAFIDALVAAIGAGPAAEVVRSHVCTPVGSEAVRAVVRLLAPAGEVDGFVHDVVEALDDDVLVAHLSDVAAVAPAPSAAWMLQALVGASFDFAPVKIPHATVEAVLCLLSRCRPDEILGDGALFDAYPHQLSDDATLALLRHGNAATTWAWLVSTGANTPRPGMLAALIAEPGGAFDNDWDDDRCTGTLPSFVEAGFWQMADVVASPDADAVIELLGAAATQALIKAAAAQHGSGAYSVAQYLARRCAAVCGDDVDMWRTALRLIPASSAPLGRTLHGVARLHRRGGHDPAVAATVLVGPTTSELVDAR